MYEMNCRQLAFFPKKVYFVELNFCVLLMYVN